MKRRQFTFGLAALAASPALPSQALATAIPSSANVASKYFTIGRLLARSHNRCSPEMLMRHLSLSVENATKLQSMLFEQGIITSSVDGVAMAVNPLNTYCVPKAALKATNFQNTTEKTIERVKKVAQKLSQDEAPKAEFEPESEETHAQNRPDVR